MFASFSPIDTCGACVLFDASSWILVNGDFLLAARALHSVPNVFGLERQFIIRVLVCRPQKKPVSQLGVICRPHKGVWLEELPSNVMVGACVRACV